MTDLNVITGTVVPIGASTTATPWRTHALGWLAGYGDATRDAYARDLRAYGTWMEARDVDPLDATRAQVTLHLRDLEASGRAPSTVARRRAAIASFYAYLVVEEILAKSPAAHVKGPKVSDASPREGCTAIEFRRLLEHAKTDGPRSHLIVCLLGLNGLRVSEACSIRPGDVRTERGHTVVKVIGKGSKKAAIPLAPRTAQAMRIVMGDVITDTALAKRGERPEPVLGLDRFAAHRLISRLSEGAGIGHRCPHDLRHSFVTNALNAGVDLRRVQVAARHSAVQTTVRYDRARRDLDDHAAYTLAAYLDQGENGEPH